MKTARAILKALPNIDSLTIHCKKATEALLNQVAKEQVVHLKEIIVTRVASTVKKDSLLSFFSAAVNAEVLYLPRNLDVDVDAIVGLHVAHEEEPRYHLVRIQTQTQNKTKQNKTMIFCRRVSVPIQNGTPEKR